jgi:uncharacterized SAM-binding protein YcdF (DUF218 family)
MRRRKTRSLLRRTGLPALAALCAIVLVAGFFAFAESVATATQPSDPRADAIVVLTGDAERIESALALLDQGRAARLLISGVNPSVTSADIAKLVTGDLRNALDCCVDLGRQATDTIGNAAEARDWVEAHGFTSLIVVTSDYHMPRSMAELDRVMPAVALTPFPVSNPHFRFDDWWQDRATFRLLVREYGKYLVAKARLLLPVDDTRIAG